MGKDVPERVVAQLRTANQPEGQRHSRRKYWGHVVTELVYQYLDADVANWLTEKRAPSLVEHIWTLLGRLYRNPVVFAHDANVGYAYGLIRGKGFVAKKSSKRTTPRSSKSGKYLKATGSSPRSTSSQMRPARPWPRPKPKG